MALFGKSEKKAPKHALPGRVKFPLNSRVRIIGVASELERISLYSWARDLKEAYRASLSATVNTLTTDRLESFNSLDELVLQRAVEVSKARELELAQVAPGIHELRSKNPQSERSAMLSLLTQLKGTNRVVEIGYKSTRTDFAGEPIEAPRSYWGKILEFDGSTLLLNLSSGTQRFIVDELAWVALYGGDRKRRAAVDYFVAEENGYHVLKVEVIDQLEQIEAGARAEIERAEELHSINREKVPLNPSLVTVRVSDDLPHIFHPHVNKLVYLEQRGSAGELLCRANVLLTGVIESLDEVKLLSHGVVVLTLAKTDYLGFSVDKS